MCDVWTCINQKVICGCPQSQQQQQQQQQQSDASKEGAISHTPAPEDTVSARPAQPASKTTSHPLESPTARYNALPPKEGSQCV